MVPPNVYFDKTPIPKSKYLSISQCEVEVNYSEGTVVDNYDRDTVYQILISQTTI